MFTLPAVRIALLCLLFASTTFVGCDTSTASAEKADTPTETSAAAEAMTLYLVRHAEKADDSEDPPLSAVGMTRADKLAALLADKQITTVYTTPYNRTSMTAEPLAKQTGIKIMTYDPTDAAFAQLVRTKHQGENVLIVGHSNTIPGLVNQLLGRQEYTDLADSEYDKLFVVTLREGATQANMQTY